MCVGNTLYLDIHAVSYMSINDEAVEWWLVCSALGPGLGAFSGSERSAEQLVRFTATEHTR